MQFCPDAGCSIGAMRSRMDRADPPRQISIRRCPRRHRPFGPSIVAGCRHFQDTRHRADGIDGLVRTHKLPGPFGLASATPREPGRRPRIHFRDMLCQDIVLSGANGDSRCEAWTVPRARHWSCHRRVCQHQDLLAGPTSRLTVLLVRTLRQALQAFGPIGPNRPSDGEIPADKPGDTFHNVHLR